jgi:hypothetical protein
MQLAGHAGGPQSGTSRSSSGRRMHLSYWLSPSASTLWWTSVASIPFTAMQTELRMPENFTAYVAPMRKYFCGPSAFAIREKDLRACTHRAGVRRKFDLRLKVREGAQVCSRSATYFCSSPRRSSIRPGPGSRYCCASSLRIETLTVAQATGAHLSFVLSRALLPIELSVQPHKSTRDI